LSSTLAADAAAAAAAAAGAILDAAAFITRSIHAHIGDWCTLATLQELR